MHVYRPDTYDSRKYFYGPKHSIYRTQWHHYGSYHPEWQLMGVTFFQRKSNDLFSHLS